MQLTKNFFVTDFTIISDEVDKSINETLDKLDDSATASARKGSMLKAQQNPPSNIRLNMLRLATALEPVKDEMISEGYGFVITSGYRCKELNDAIGGKPNSAHLRGLGADIRFTSPEHAKALIDSLIRAGFKRIGLGSTFIHADLDLSLPHPACWLYSSKFKTPAWLQALEPGIDKRLAA